LAAKTGGVIKVVRQKYIQVSDFKYYLCQKLFQKVLFCSLSIGYKKITVENIFKFSRLKLAKMLPNVT